MLDLTLGIWAWEIINTWDLPTGASNEVEDIGIVLCVICYKEWVSRYS